MNVSGFSLDSSSVNRVMVRTRWICRSIARRIWNRLNTVGGNKVWPRTRTSRVPITHLSTILAA